MKKSVIAILTTVVIALSLLGPAFYTLTVKADLAEWYMGKAGVLNNDYYSLYPFEKNSLTIGFSKYGEMVNPYTGNGLNYSGRDPFANEGIDMKYWLQGWFADIRYVHRVYGARHMWAMATYADMIAYGGDWLNNHTDPYGAPHGGRKCSGSAVSDPITVLYDGPRRFVAVVKTHLNDTTVDSSWPVLDIIFTFIFNKDKKEVIVLKDIKLTIDSKILETPVNVQFSNRGEWDLGPSPDWKSYAHFYHQEFPTCFGADWHLAKTILREYKFHSASWSGQTLNLISAVNPAPPYGLPVVWRSEYVYVNGVWQKPGTDYNIDYKSGIITFTTTLYNAEVEVYFKLHKRDEIGPMPLPHQYDVAQIISRDEAVVGYAAFWPVLSDYSVDAWDRALEPLYVANEPDMLPVPSEPDIPFVVGEWDFMLDYDEATPDWGEQFRGVTVYGIVNYHNAHDVQMDGTNALDIEVTYQLDEVFNPWSLVDAVHKDTQRWVQFYNVTADDVYWATNFGVPLRIWLDHSPVLYEPIWEDYKGFSEKVLWGGALKKPIRSVYTAYDYELYTKPDGTGYIWIPAAKVPAAGTVIKILYSTDTFYRSFDYYTFYFEKNDTTSVDGYYFSDSHSWKDWLGAKHRFDIGAKYSVTNVSTPAPGASFKISGTLDFYAEDIKVFKEDTAEIGCYKLWDYGANKWHHEEADNTFDIDFYYFDLSWFITPPPGEDLHIEWAHIDVDYTITIDYNGTYYNTTATFNINGLDLKDPYGVKNPLYVERIPGRYEWITVGNWSRAIDSAGASVVAAAFKNKQIEIGLSGLDVQDPAWGPYVPYVLSNMGHTGTGHNPTMGYYDAIGRLAFKDDWCYPSKHAWPVASSNIIAVGGPAANIVSEYFNEFTDAFIYSTLGGILALPCWSKNVYTGGGYAVISTYKDLNGTVGLVIWGWTGDDTYYATKWFHEEGIFQLQYFPPCVTTIILKIDYTDHPPTVTVEECLGTISETLVHEVKGGIHPDP